MSTMKDSAHYSGLLPIVRPIALENDRFADGQPSLRRRASRGLSRSLIAFCAGVAVTLAWWSYDDAARQMIANWHPRLGWLPPQTEPVAQSAPNMIALGAPATPSFDQQQLSAMSLNLDAVRQSIDRIVAGQEQMMRSIDQIAASITAGQDQTTRAIGQIATSIAVVQQQTTRTTDQTSTSVGQASSADPNSITVEGRPDNASSQATVRSDIKPTEVRPAQTLVERRQPSLASGGDPSCFPSASAVMQKHPGGWPSWTMKAPGHEGTVCWYAAARPRTSNHRRELTPGEKETAETTENRPPAPPAPYTRAPE